ncbi:acetyltransferase (GNAT) family domain-containing protein [Ditylenchus destructor]|nr:acetyltransferase (GNAT) family domain-containing protein [Ditylenchus destructor]
MSEYYFKQAFCGDNNVSEQFEHLLRETILPLYGQSAWLEKVKNDPTRTSLLLLNTASEPVGVLMYKNEPSSEFIDHGIEQSVEIKTLFVVHPSENRGRGIGTTLLSQVEEYAKRVGAKMIHVTVSEIVPESMKFFQKNGFTVTTSFAGKYRDGVKEHLLVKNIQ